MTFVVAIISSQTMRITFQVVCIVIHFNDKNILVFKNDTTAYINMQSMLWQIMQMNYPTLAEFRIYVALSKTCQ